MTRPPAGLHSRAGFATLGQGTPASRWWRTVTHWLVERVKVAQAEVWVQPTGGSPLPALNRLWSSQLQAPT